MNICAINHLRSLYFSYTYKFYRRETVTEGGDRTPQEFSVFDALRDTIYSEVATLIANNENRPHFLVSALCVCMCMHVCACMSL